MSLNQEIYQQLKVAASQNCLLRTQAQDLLNQWRNPPDDAVDYLELVLACQRVAKCVAAGALYDPALLKAVSAASEKGWKDIVNLPCDATLEKQLGRNMLGVVGKHGDGNVCRSGHHLLIDTGLNGRRAVEYVAQYCMDQHVPFDVIINDTDFDTALVNALPETQVMGLMESVKRRFINVDPHLRFAESEEPEQLATRNKSKFAIYEQASRENRTLRGNGDIKWVLTKIPSKSEARLDGFETYGAYLDYFFEVLDQPYTEIYKAQHKLISAFNPGEEIHITNDDGTDVFVKVSGMKFANSAPGRNLPGSEFFSGPTSVDGRVVAKGNFAYNLNGKLLEMRDLELVFEKGKLVSAKAAQGQESLDAILAVDEGANRAGEIGLGSNPGIQRHLVNSLLVEKISGSFHIALGDAYGDSYLDQDVKMDNGNKSKVHWDITTMLRGKNGKIELDGHLLQDNGRWVACPALNITDKDVAVLNDGWKAIPPARRPSHINQRLEANQPLTR